ncbi:MAG: hypothetical protein V7707_18370 [Motiliproteus sp.]
MRFDKTVIATAVTMAFVSSPLMAAIDGKLSGHINRAVMFFDDGETSQTRHVDNDSSSTRVRFNGATTVDTTTVGINMEFQAESNSTADVNQDRGDNDFEFGERILEFTVSDNWGKISVGQGSTASDGTSEKDMSGTTLVGYSDTNISGGGLLFRESGDKAEVPGSGITVGGVFTNMDGNSRKDRFRYDTPSMAGFSLGLSHADSGDSDLGLHYGANYSGMKLAAGLGYVDYDSGDNDSQLAGSVSVALDGGLNVTAAGGSRDAKSGSDADFGYLKVGYRMGDNAFSVDYHLSDEAEAGHEGTSYGVQYVRDIKAFSTEAYAGVRNYELKDNSGAANYEDVAVALIGARVKF